MNNNIKSIESLLERVEDYGVTSYELVKLKAFDKTSVVVSSVVTNSILYVIFIIFLLFLNLGVSIWLGDKLGKSYYGFFAVSAFYGLVCIIMYLFMRKWFIKFISNFFISQVFK